MPISCNSTASYEYSELEAVISFQGNGRPVVQEFSRIQIVELDMALHAAPLIEALASSSSPPGPLGHAHDPSVAPLRIHIEPTGGVVPDAGVPIKRNRRPERDSSFHASTTRIVVCRKRSTSKPDAARPSGLHQTGISTGE